MYNVLSLEFDWLKAFGKRKHTSYWPSMIAMINNSKQTQQWLSLWIVKLTKPIRPYRPKYTSSSPLWNHKHMSKDLIPQYVCGVVVFLFIWWSIQRLQRAARWVSCKWYYGKIYGLGLHRPRPAVTVQKLRPNVCMWKKRLFCSVLYACMYACMYVCVHVCV